MSLTWAVFFFFKITPLLGLTLVKVIAFCWGGSIGLNSKYAREDWRVVVIVVVLQRRQMRCLLFLLFESTIMPSIGEKTACILGGIEHVASGTRAALRIRRMWLLIMTVFTRLLDYLGIFVR